MHGARVLLYNGTLAAASPLTLLGQHWNYFVSDPAALNQANSEGFGALSAYPDGYYPPHAMILPRTGGRLRSNFKIEGASTVTAPAQAAREMAASISGAGTIPGCDLGLIVSIVATLVSSGGISSASVDALAGMVASLTGSGDITATAAGLADLGAAITGSGSVNASNTALMDIAATIRGYGDLTPEGIRDAVWNALVTTLTAPGTAGAALLAAGSAGDPWGTPLPGAYAAGSAGAILGNLIAGLSPTEQAQLLDIWQRLGLDISNPLVTTSTSIEAGGVSQTIDEAAGPIITVTRT